MKGNEKMAYTINQRVAIYRKMANLTQTEAAERLGMKCSTYSQMERKGNISVDKLMAIAEVFGVNPAVLLRDPMDLQAETESAEAAYTKHTGTKSRKASTNRIIAFFRLRRALYIRPFPSNILSGRYPSQCKRFASRRI